jgi:hypothetical protein
LFRPALCLSLGLSDDCDVLFLVAIPGNVSGILKYASAVPKNGEPLTRFEAIAVLGENGVRINHSSPQLLALRELSWKNDVSVQPNPSKHAGTQDQSR